MTIKSRKDDNINDEFIFSPKNDFVFKLLFGDEKNKKAYSILEVISKDDTARAAYEAREAELHD